MGKLTACRVISDTRSVHPPTLAFEAAGIQFISSVCNSQVVFEPGAPMTTALEILNPFSLMMEPERVLQTMERSQQLRGLRRHKLRPLDKPLIPYTSEALARRAAF